MSEQSRTSALLLLVLLLLAGVLKADYLAAHEAQEPLHFAPYGDSVVWLDEVQRAFGQGGDRGAFYKPPLYTVLLAQLGAQVEGAGRQAVRWGQLGLGLGILTLVFLWAQSLAASRSGRGHLAGTLAFLALLFYAPMSFQETKLLDSLLGLFLALLSCFLLWRAERAALGRNALLGIGVLFGLAGLARTANLLLVPAFALVLFAQGRRGPAAALLLGCVLAITPVGLHNVRACGELLPINYSEGHTFLVGNNENSRGIYTLPPGYPDGVLNERLVEQGMARQALGHLPSPAEQRDHSYATGWHYLSTHPARIPGLLFDKLRFALSSYEVDDNYSLHRERQRFGLLRWAWLPFTALLALGLAFFVERDFPDKRFLAIPLAFNAGLLLVFYVNARYRLPLAPFLAIGGGVFLAGRFRSQNTSPLRRAATVLMLLAPFAFTTLAGLPYTQHELRESEQFFDIVLDLHAANTRIQHGDVEQAAAILARGIQTHPSSPDLAAALPRLLAQLPAAERARAESAAAKARETPTGEPRDP